MTKILWDYLTQFHVCNSIQCKFIFVAYSLFWSWHVHKPFYVFVEISNCHNNLHINMYLMFLKYIKSNWIVLCLNIWNFTTTKSFLIKQLNLIKMPIELSGKNVELGTRNSLKNWFSLSGSVLGKERHYLLFICLFQW